MNREATVPANHMALELAEKLDRLDPGNVLPVDPAFLEEVFGPGKTIEMVIQAAEEFAEEHRCTFSYAGHPGDRPVFTKDDVF
jgi:hypothetical protein